MSQPADNTPKTLLNCFAELEDADPRVERGQAHLFSDILVVALCAIICGADGWVQVERWGLAQQAWLQTFLKLPGGIPSHDTFGRVFAALDPALFRDAFVKWVSAIANLTAGEVVAIDGKTLRRSFDRAAKKAAIHMVSAWARKNRLVLGQFKTEEKSNEITAVPKLLAMLVLKGCIVTVDALNSQRDTATAILAKEADYIMPIKGNQPTVQQEVTRYFTEAEKQNWAAGVFHTKTTVDGDHGRIETRRYVAAPVGALLGLEETRTWPGINSVMMTTRQREIDGKVTVEAQAYISSLRADQMDLLEEATRGHWSIENDLHWTLDVQFDEDQCRVRKDNAPENLAILRHMALNLIKQEKTAKVGVDTKRKMAGWNTTYLLKILGSGGG